MEGVVIKIHMLKVLKFYTHASENGIKLFAG